jgi:hypothetical protein
MPRKFEDHDAIEAASREPKGLSIALTGPQFSGKSYSAGRLATGIRRVTGGQIYWGDSENDRALELAPYFKFRHVPFPQPKEPREYEELMRYLLAKPDCGVIILDQCTHEHVAMLNMIEEYLDKKAGDNWEKRAVYQAASMIRPKAQRKRFEELVAYGCRRASDGFKVPIIMLYRATDKSVPGKSKRDGGDGQWVHKGWQAETTSTLPYFMTARFLLPPGSDGHPNMTPDTEWEKLAIRNPQQFRDWFKPGFQLTEEVGERLALWAAGRQPAESPSIEDTKPLLESIRATLKAHGIAGSKDAAEPLTLAFGATWARVEKMPASELKVGLEALRHSLEGLAALKNQPLREPGEDPEEGEVS